jgi:hypothetical protein
MEVDNRQSLRKYVAYNFQVIAHVEIKCVGGGQGGAQVFGTPSFDLSSHS